MDNNTTSNEDEAHIQLLHITRNDEQQLRQLLNSIWFFYSVKQCNTPIEEDQFFDNLNKRKPDHLFDILIADFRSNSPFTQSRKENLFHLLKKHQRPLISLSEEPFLKCDEENKNWIHISAPVNLLTKNAVDIKDKIANYWFNLPCQREHAD